MTGNDSTTFLPGNGELSTAVDAPITAASVWFAAGRFILRVTNALTDVDTVYVAGGQLWFDGSTVENTVLPGNFVLATSNYSGDSVNNYFGAAVRMDATTTLNGVTTVLSPTKITFGGNKLLTLATLAGSGDLNLVSQSDGALKVNALSAYTGTITVGVSRLEFSDSVAVLPAVTLNRAASALKLAAPATLAPGSKLLSGTLDLSALTLSDTAAAITIPDTSVTFASGFNVNLGDKRWATETIRVFAVPEEAPTDYRDVLKSIRVTVGGRIFALNENGFLMDYPDIRSAPSFTSEVIGRDQDLWINLSSNSGAQIAGITAPGRHVRISSGTMAADGDPADASSFTVQNGWSKALSAPITAASLTIEGGRFSLGGDGVGLLANAGTIYLSGGHIYPTKGGETFANDFYFSTAAYAEGNAYGSSVYRVDDNTTFNGASVIRSASKFSFGGASNRALTFANLSGAGNMTFGVYTGTGHRINLDNISAYTGTITIANAALTLTLTQPAAPVFSLSAGFLKPASPITLRSGTSITGGTLDFSSVTLPGTITAAMTIPAGATVSVGANATFQLGANYAFPVTLKIFEVEPGATLNGWNPATAIIAMGNIQPSRVVNADGTITFDIERTPFTFTKPSSDWDSKLFPTEALQALAPVTDTIEFGTDMAFQQTLDGKTSTVANITGGGSSTVSAYGLHGRGGDRSTITRDIWLAVSGGTFLNVVGGCENYWQSNKASSIQGDILTEMTGNSRTAALIGGIQDSGTSKNHFISGNIGVVVGENAMVSGSIIGGATSAHEMGVTINGNIAVLIKNAQKETNYAASTTPFFSGFIVGGSAWKGNVASEGTINGNTAVTIDLPEGTTENFRKTLVGGSHSINGSAKKGTFAISGTAAVSVSAPETTRFLHPIYGAGYSENDNPVTTGASAVTINGGTFFAEIAAGGFGAQSAVAGDAALIINGGVLTNTVLRGSSGGTVGGLKRLVVSGERTIDLTQTTAIEFSRVEASDGATLMLGQGTQADAAIVTNATLALSGKASADSTDYRYIRLTVFDHPRTNPNGNLAHVDSGVAIGEFRLTLDGVAIPWNGATITADPENSNASENSSKMIDNSTATGNKYYTYTANALYTFTIDRGANAGAFNGYELFGSDQDGRAPLAWTLFASTDGVNWVVFDQQRLTYAQADGWTYDVARSFTCARTEVPSSIGSVIVSNEGTLTGSGHMINNLTFESGSTLLKTSTDPRAALWIAGTITPPASGRVAVIGPDVELSTGDKHYLLTGPGAIAANASAFQAADGLVISRDATGLFLTRQSGLLIRLF